MRYAAEHYGVECVGLTISKDQAAWGQKRCTGLPVRFILADYRTFNVDGKERFDRIASVGMFEHVGVRNYKAYFAMARRSLRDDGLFLLHTIGKNRRGGAPIRGSRNTSSPTGSCPRSAKWRMRASTGS